MGLEESILIAVEKQTVAVQTQSEKVAELKTAVALNSQATGELSSRVVDLGGDVRDLRDRVAVTETRLSERTRPVKTRNSVAPRPVNGKSTAKVVGSIIAALVALTGVVITVLAAANCG